MQELLAIIAKGLVDDPDAVSVDRDETNEEGVTVYHIHGRIAKAIRTIAKSASIRMDERVMVEID